MHLLHLVDVTVARLAGHPSVDVCGVVKVDVIWRLVDAYPLDWFLHSPLDRRVIFIHTHRSTEWRKLRASLLNMLVTVPTGIGRGHSSRGRLIY